MRYHYTPTRIVKNRTRPSQTNTKKTHQKPISIPTADDKQLDSPKMLSGMQNSTTALRNDFVVSYKVKHTFNMNQ